MKATVLERGVYLHAKCEGDGVEVSTYSRDEQSVVRLYADKNTFRVYVDVDVNGKFAHCGLVVKRVNETAKVEAVFQYKTVSLDGIDLKPFAIVPQFGNIYNTLDVYLVSDNVREHLSISYDAIYRSVIVNGDVSALQKLLISVLF